MLSVFVWFVLILIPNKFLITEFTSIKELIPNSNFDDKFKQRLVSSAYLITSQFWIDELQLKK